MQNIGQNININKYRETILVIFTSPYTFIQNNFKIILNIYQPLFSNSYCDSCIDYRVDLPPK